MMTAWFQDGVEDFQGVERILPEADVDTSTRIPQDLSVWLFWCLVPKAKGKRQCSDLRKV